MDVGFFQSIARDLSGKGQFRLFLQPAMAVILGVRLGIRDAKAGKTPYLLRQASETHGRWVVFKESLTDAILPLTVALVMDAIFQRITLGRVRPLVALVVGAILVWIPFVITRGLSNRIWKRSRLEHVERTS